MMLRRLVTRYNDALQKYPKSTNAVMTGTLFGLGDIIAQNLFPEQRSSEEMNAQSKIGFDWSRNVRAVVYGSIIFAPIGIKWYQLLNSKIRFPDVAKNSKKNLLLRVAVDQCLFAPLAIPFYFTCLTIMENKPLSTIKDKLNVLWWSTLSTNWKIWPVFQLLNFSIVPLQHRLLAVNVLAIFWNTFLSYENSKLHFPSESNPVYYPPIAE